MAKKLKRKNIDFYSAFYKKPKLDREQLKKHAVIVAPVAIVVVLLLVTGLMYCQIFYATMQAKEINAALEDVNIQEAVEAAKGLEKDIDAAKSQKSYLTTMEKMISDYPVFTSEVFSDIYATAGSAVYTYMSYDAPSGVLTISAQAPKVTDAATSAAALRGMDVFSGVQYQGYDSGADDVYAFEIYCVMKGGDSE